MGTTTFSLAIAWALLTASPPEHVVSDRVDLVELNHLFDEHGKPVFDQLLFYDWSPEQSRYQVRAWRLVKSPSQLPQRDWQRGDYFCRWYDGELLREVRAGIKRETWTQYDPELVEREYLPKEARRELLGAFKGKRNVQQVVTAARP